MSLSLPSSLSYLLPDTPENDVDLDEFRRAVVQPQLRVDQLLDELDGTDPDFASVLRQALEGDPVEFPAGRIAAVLRQRGLKVSRNAIVTWRERRDG